MYVEQFLNDREYDISDDESEPEEKKQRTTTPEPELECPCLAGTCSCRTPQERRPWKPPDLPPAHSYANIKVAYHEDFDIKAAAQDWFSPDHPCIVVKHTRGAVKKPHWHIHGAVLDVRHSGNRKVWYNKGTAWPHPLHAETGKKGKSAKPYSSKTFTGEAPPENGYMYCVKPRESCGRCIIHYHHGFGEGDLYQVYEQSIEYDKANNISFDEKEEDVVETLFDATKHHDLNIVFRKLFTALVKHYHAHGRRAYNIRRLSVHYIMLKWPGGIDFIYEKGWG